VRSDLAHRKRGEKDPSVISANEALERLREGNRRFVAGEHTIDELASGIRRMAVVSGQRPIAAILGCSDSRVPVEVVFDQGFGDLFVIRVAGNVVAPSQIGSVEFAAERLGTRLVVVLGHTRCGAVTATLEDLQRPVSNQSWNMNSIVGRIRPSVEGLLATELKNDPERLIDQAVRANVRASVNQLRHGSDVLELLLRRDGLRVVGAEYSLETGIVDFFD
jgi:carbonic anhydrase